MLQFTYPVKLTRDRKDGGYVVSCRDIPEVITQGDSIEDALSEAEGALQAALLLINATPDEMAASFPPALLDPLY